MINTVSILYISNNYDLQKQDFLFLCGRNGIP